MFKKKIQASPKSLFNYKSSLHDWEVLVLRARVQSSRGSKRKRRQICFHSPGWEVVLAMCKWWPLAQLHLSLFLPYLLILQINPIPHRHASKNARGHGLWWDTGPPTGQAGGEAGQLPPLASFLLATRQAKPEAITLSQFMTPWYFGKLFMAPLHQEKYLTVLLHR